MKNKLLALIALAFGLAPLAQATEVYIKNSLGKDIDLIIAGHNTYKDSNNTFTIKSGKTVRFFHPKNLNGPIKFAYSTDRKQKSYKVYSTNQYFPINWAALGTTLALEKSENKDTDGDMVPTIRKTFPLAAWGQKHPKYSFDIIKTKPVAVGSKEVATW